MKNFYDETFESLSEVLNDLGFKTFNARQIFDWIYKKQITDFSLMTNLSKSLREVLLRTYTFGILESHTKQESKDGTKKYLFKLHDGHLVETVLMQHDYGLSLCVTTQVGCNIGCSFCASGLQKKVRNLTIGEMSMQVISVMKDIDTKLTHIVIMGTGEPFDNYENVMGFIDVVNSPYGLEIGARHITVSTSGIVPKIYAFAKEKKQVNLAISLHAPNDQIRSRLMKINDVYPLSDVINSVKKYIEETNRRVTFEYILLNGENDQIHHADELSDLLRGINAYVNLIRYNAISEFDYRSTPEEQAKKFHERLLKRGITATLRREKGADIDAACGQLRAKSVRKG